MTSYHLILEWWLPWDCGLWWQNVALEMEVKLFATWQFYITLCCFSISRGEMQKEEDEEVGGDYGGHGGAVPSWQHQLHAQYFISWCSHLCKQFGRSQYHQQYHQYGGHGGNAPLGNTSYLHAQYSTATSVKNQGGHNTFNKSWHLLWTVLNIWIVDQTPVGRGNSDLNCWTWLLIL